MRGNKQFTNSDVGTEAMNRKVLIICRSYYPHYGPQAQRMAGFAKHLPKFGWEPVVLCPESTLQNDSKYDPKLVGKDFCRTIRVPYNISATRRRIDFLVRKALKDLSLEVLLFRSPVRIYRDMLARTDSLLEEEKFDAILATTGSPLTLAIADKVSRRYHTPWVADFRDIPAQHIANLRRFSPHHLYIKLHKECCNSATALVTTTESLRERLTQWQDKPVSLIYNGFDPDNLHQDLQPSKDYFTLAYCGTIHDTANPKSLLNALDLILERDPAKLERFRLLIYGVSKICFRRHFANKRCSHLIHNKGRVSFEDSIKAQQEACALLFLSYAGMRGVITAKLLEYLGAGRPILSVPGDDVTSSLLEETQTGLAARTEEEIARILLDWLDQWQRTGKVQYDPRQDKILFYTRENQTKRLAQILDQVAATRL
jgi:glycosyltransferase involved in cell wall biosynthesis